MSDGRYKPITIQGVKERQRSLDELLSLAQIDGFIPDEEFARDMDLLVSGKMSPAEHREYLKKKYQQEPA